MKVKKKQSGRNLLSMLCMLLIVGGTFNCVSLKVNAAEVASTDIDILQSDFLEYEDGEQGNLNARTMLVNCSILTSCSGDGLHIEISTCAYGDASVLGVKDIVIMKKVWYGWKTIATGSGGEQNDCSIMGLQIDYPNVEYGETYRITCVHYGDVDGYEEVENDTGAFVFEY